MVEGSLKLYLQNQNPYRFYPNYQLHIPHRFSEFPVAVGVDTQSSIAFGIDRGIIGLVRELIDGAAAQYGNDGKITVVFTGGDAAWFSAHFPGSFTAPADFTLRGLLKVTEK